VTFASNGAAPHASRHPRRVCVLSVHTSPLEQPGTGDAGGMNVYVVETATRMARAGVAVEIFTRATSSEQPPVAALAPGVLVRHVAAGPFEGLGKNDLPSQLCAFTAGVLRAEARHEPGYYDVVHSHYWLSGQVGWLARDRWGVPLVHSAHTLARVKNAALAEGDEPEPMVRVIGEDQVVAEADRLIGNTDEEARQLIELYGADPRRTVTIPPGVDLARFRPGSRAAARAELGLPRDAVVLAFVGRIQPLKAPDVLLRAAAERLRRDPALRERLVVLVAGGPSGTGLAEPTWLQELAAALGIGDCVRFLPPQGAGLVEVYRAADVVAVPSHNESFGLVALEAQACGTPVVAARVGGLPVAVADGRSGLLVPGHRAEEWADALAAAIGRRDELGAGAVAHAREFSWDRTADALLATYTGAATEFAQRQRILAGLAS
jgi:D-inositol-3-phosphate glycosyltransferase